MGVLRRREGRGRVNNEGAGAQGNPNKTRDKGRKEKKVRFATNGDDHLTHCTVGALLGIAGVLVALFAFFYGSIHFANTDQYRLSDLQRKLLLHSEQAFYYSFYDTFVEAKDWREGFKKLTADTGVEYPSTVNPLERFNIYIPELAIGTAYRSFRGISIFGEEISEHISAYAFYTESIYILHAMGLCGLVFIGWITGDYLIYGAIVASSTILANWSNLYFTRISQAPLRENCGTPLLWIQIGFLLMILRVKNGKVRTQKLRWVELMLDMGYFLTTLSFLLAWQFSHYVLLTQVASLIATYVVVPAHVPTLWRLSVLRLLVPNAMQSFASHPTGNHLKYPSFCSLSLSSLAQATVCAFSLQFGNQMLLGSMFWQLDVSIIVLRIFGLGKSILARAFWIIVVGVTFLSLRILSSFFLDLSADSHVFGILMGKLGLATHNGLEQGEKFESLIYQIEVPFQPISRSLLENISSTGLPYLLLVSLGVSLLAAAAGIIRDLRGKKATWKLIPLSEIYLVFQVTAFAILAGLVQRLLVLALPLSCAGVSLLVSPIIQSQFPGKAISWLPKHVLNFAIMLSVVVFTLAMTPNGIFMKKAVYSPDEAKADLVAWINNYSDINSSFTSDMTTTSVILVGSGRPITLHPHFEYQDLRRRVEHAYHVFGCPTVQEAHNILQDLETDYFVINASPAYKVHSRNDKMLANSPYRCRPNTPPSSRFLLKVLEEEHSCPYFEMVYRNGVYSVLQLRKIEHEGSYVDSSVMECTPYYVHCQNTDPKCEFHLFEWANFWDTTMGDMNKAVQEFVQAINYFPNSAVLRNGYALLVDLGFGNLALAEENYKLAVELSPLVSKYQLDYAMFLDMGKQDTHGAVPYYNRSVQLDPNNVNALCSFGLVLKLKLQKDEEGLLLFQKAKSLIEAGLTDDLGRNCVTNSLSHFES